MPVGGDKAQLVAFHLHQQTIEIIANILHRHAVLHLANHVFQRFLRQGKLGMGGFADVHGGKIGGRQGLQIKARFACFERELVFVQIQLHGGVFGQGAQDVLQFFGVGGELEIAFVVVCALGVDLDFQIGGENVHFAAFAFQQHVRQNGQGVFALNDACGGLQGFEQRVALGLQD